MIIVTNPEKIIDAKWKKLASTSIAYMILKGTGDVHKIH